MPRSGLDAAVDFVVDDGHPERRRRLGIFDNEFRGAGVLVPRAPLGEFVAFLHFADHFRLKDWNRGDAKVTGSTRWRPGLRSSQAAKTPNVRTETQKAATRKTGPIVGPTKDARKENAPEGYIDLTSSRGSGSSP